MSLRFAAPIGRSNAIVDSKLQFERQALQDIDFEALDQLDDRLFSQRRCWLEFVTSFVPGEIVVAALTCEGRRVGFFTGILFKRAGVKILASPFRGWTTPYMGFNLEPGVPRVAALQALERFAFHELGCLHLEIADRYLSVEDGIRHGFAHRAMNGYLSDLTKSEDALWKGMTSACRRAIRKSEKSGVVIAAGEPKGFAEDYISQLQYVFAKQGLRPTYGIDRVERLIESCFDSGDLLLLRAFEPGGQCIATGIYPGFRRYSFFWGNASHPDFQILRPNEALHWFAMRYWKARGSCHHDWGGSGAYKKKYGGTPFTVPSFWKSRYGFVRVARDTAEKLFYLPRILRRRRYDAKIAAGRNAS